MSVSKNPVIVASLLALSTSAVAQTPQQGPASEPEETVVVTANRVGSEQSVDSLGTAVSVLTRDQLETRQTRFVSDALRDLPGVAVSRTGTIGGLTQVRMRGAEGNHTLVLLEGADISDPFQGEFDFSGLVATDIARIEALRGEQSSLYGSDAIGGVLNIIPRRGGGELSFGGFAEGGAFSTHQLSVNGGYGSERADVFASVSRFSTSGINISRFGSEEDGARNTSSFLNVGMRPLPNLVLRALLRQVETDFETDPQDFAFPSRPTQGFVIDGNNTGKSRQLYGALSADLSLLDGRWVTRAGYAFADISRQSFTDDLPAFFTDGTRGKVSVFSSVTLETGSLKHRVTGGLDQKRETFRNVPTGAPGPTNLKRELDTRAYALAYDFTSGRFGFGIAVRHDDNERFRSADTFRVQTSYLLADSGTRVRASAGTGIKAPTNFELFGFNPTSFIGNPSLVAEESRGFDIGLEQSFLNERVRAGVTYFQADLKNEIFTAFLPGFVSTPRNRVTSSPRSGIESTLDMRLDKNWSINLAHTWLEAEESGLEEVRRPPHSGSLNIAWHSAERRTTAALTVRHNGSQQDSEFISATPQSRVTLPSYTLVNFNASYQLTSALSVFGRVENLLDEDYEEVFTFRTQGRGGFLGVKVAL